MTVAWIGWIILLGAAVVFALAARDYFRAAARHRAAAENYRESVEWLRNVQKQFPSGSTSNVVRSEEER